MAFSRLLLSRLAVDRPPWKPITRRIGILSKTVRNLRQPSIIKDRIVAFNWQSVTSLHAASRCRPLFAVETSVCYVGGMAQAGAKAIEAANLPVEERLIEGLRAGDDAAYEQLVRTFGPRLLAVIRRFLPSEDDGQDALQDAFLSAFKAIDRFQGDSSLGTWLHRIAVNAALMKLRSRKRRPERPIEDLLPRFLEDGHREHAGPAWAVSHDTAVADRETRELVRRLIDQLPDSYRTILLLRDIEERSTEETAGILELSVANVKTRLHRARQALRELLDPYLGGDLT
jgi:RNA polymerase sigma-70 factor, ECF subfamily